MLASIRISGEIKHTPAKTLVISRTFSPFKGNVISFESDATSAKVLRRTLQIAEDAPLECTSLREALRKEREFIECIMILQK
jgi:hypothetical protein